MRISLKKNNYNVRVTLGLCLVILTLCGFDFRCLFFMGMMKMLMARFFLLNVLWVLIWRRLACFFSSSCYQHPQTISTLIFMGPVCFLLLFQLTFQVTFDLERYRDKIALFFSLSSICKATDAIIWSNMFAPASFYEAQISSVHTTNIFGRD